jgi:hypothetical protein
MPILQDAMQQGTAQPGGQPQQGGQLPPPKAEISSPVVQSHMDELEGMRSLMQGKLGEAYDRVLTAGKKMLYAAENAEMVQGLILDEQVPLKNKLGEGVANLVVMLDNAGNGTIPKEVIVPVGIALMFEAADYLFECGIDVTEQDLSESMEILVYGVFDAYGAKPEQVDAVIDDMAKKLDFKDDGEQEAAEPAEGEEQAAFEQGFAEQQQGV